MPSFEKSVKGATKIKLAPPKSKYIEHIFVATHAGDAGVAEIFRTLQHRLRDSTWTIVFKSLIVVHLMIREGEPNVTLKYLAESPSKLAISNFSDGLMAKGMQNVVIEVFDLRPTDRNSAQVQGSNVRHYYTYLLVRAKAYRDTRLDWVREGQGRLKRQTIDKGLLRETEIVQGQISALLKCDILNNEPENEITLTAFRLLTMDLLVLFHVMNEGTINVLEHYFEMSKFDAERALNIYKNFSKQTNQVVEYLSTARSYENATRLEIPKLKHAPTSLTGSLEEYLQDPDFEINRRQYLAQQEAKINRKKLTNGNAESSKRQRTVTNKNPETSHNTRSSDVGPPTPAKTEPKGPAPDLIDLFDSIEQNQQPMAIQSQQVPNFQAAPQFFQSQQQPQPPQPSTFTPQSQDLYNPNGQLQQQSGASLSNINSNPFGQPQPQPLIIQQPAQQSFTGAQFSNYNQQPFGQQQNPPSTIPTPSNSDFMLRQSPFSITQQPQPNSDFSLQQATFASDSQQQSTNPFRQPVISQPTAQTPQFTNTSPLPASQSYQSTNPFARNISSQQSGSQPHSSPFTSPPPQTQPSSSNTYAFSPASQSPHLQTTVAGTNPFTWKSTPSQNTLSPIVSNQTGSTNPFRQSTFNPSWTANQGTMGGLEQLDTVPVFPRPGQQPQSQNQN